MNPLHYFANPARFLRLAQAVLPWCVGITVVCLLAGLWLGLFVAPAAADHKEAYRIMFVHVPAAWMSLFVYAMLAAAGASTLVWRHPLAGLAAKAAAPVGAGFTFVALATGWIWGMPGWGTRWDMWWVWLDPRLASMLVLFFFYLGHIALTNAFDDPTRGARAAAILALVGVVNLPIIKYSVQIEAWHSLHQRASVSKFATPSIDASMLWPLLLMAVAFTFYFLTLLILRIRSEIAARKLHAQQLGAARPR